jgi:hypothetical protein
MMGVKIDNFLESKINSNYEATHYSSLLMLSARGREDLLKSFTYSKVREILAERREKLWGAKTN